MQMVNDSNKINATEKPLFEIKEQIIPSLPEITNPRTLDVRYPLIPPYAYAHISWDEKNTELVYKIEDFYSIALF